MVIAGAGLQALTKKFPDLELLDATADEPSEFNLEADFEMMLAIRSDADGEGSPRAGGGGGGGAGAEEGAEKLEAVEGEEQLATFEQFQEWWAIRTGDNDPEISVLPAGLVSRIDEMCSDSKLGSERTGR